MEIAIRPEMHFSPGAAVGNDAGQVCSSKGVDSIEDEPVKTVVAVEFVIIVR